MREKNLRIFHEERESERCTVNFPYGNVFSGYLPLFVIAAVEEKPAGKH